jgi:hypothetical protein
MFDLHALLPVLHSIKFNNFEFQQVSSLTYFDVIVDCQLNWHSHVNAVRDKVVKSLRMLKAVCHFLPKSCLVSIYNAYILPNLMYCIAIWGNAHTSLYRSALCYSKILHSCNM